jgi:hypothetical protein
VSQHTPALNPALNPALTVRSFLVSGLLAGILAGLSTFVVGYFVAEPHVQAAIDIEEASSAQEPADHDHGHEADDAVAGHTHEEGGTVVSRHNQRTWGLLTGTLTVSLVFGGIIALVAAGVAGRLGGLSLGQSTALVAVVGWVSVAFVPWLKYPASPPAVGNADTIGSRTGWFFLFLAISVVMAVIAVALAKRVYDQAGAFPAVVAGVAAYLFVVVVAGQVLPTVNELGDFPADTLWYFRRAALIVSATMWGVLGVAITAAVRRLAVQHDAVTRRRELAASL